MANRLLVVLVGVVGCLAGYAGSAAGAGEPLYPDLRPRPPSELVFDTEVLADGATHHVLRFTTVVWNAGRGRLELEGTPRPRDRGTPVYQNLYDRPAGGARVAHRRVAVDLVFHPGHDHYHLEDFAAYLLLRKDADGAYRPTTKRGAKASFCVMDSEWVRGPHRPHYEACGRALQGLTPGWADAYGAWLPDQWVDLGAAPLADGDYAVKVTADPRNKLDEGGRDGNNAAQTCFRVRGGGITITAC